MHVVLLYTVLQWRMEKSVTVYNSITYSPRNTSISVILVPVAVCLENFARALSLSHVTGVFYFVGLSFEVSLFSLWGIYAILFSLSSLPLIAL